jgi:preprotein translocase subunit SecF
MGRYSRFGNDLYSGRRSIDFVGRKWLWFAISAVVIVIAISGLVFRGLNLSIDFTGGDEYTVSLPTSQVNQTTADTLREDIANTGIAAAEQPIVNTSGTASIQIQTKELTQAEQGQIVDVIVKATGIDPNKDLTQSLIGANWGETVTRQAATGLVIFIIVVVLFIWAYFRQWKMSLAAMIALAHDVIITIGIYALSGFEVSPATVTGFLTILGFSLYDTVVVFDKIRENTKNLRSSKTTYAKAANLAVNQTLVRSINTSIVALIPVLSILYVSTVQLGASTLKDLALALAIGMATGAYSSIFIATPVLVWMKSGEKEVVDAERRDRSRVKQADRYASVPTFKEDLPVSENPEELDEDDDLDDTEGGARISAPVHNEEAMGRGRTLPAERRPVAPSGSAGRQQPQRKPKSKRK